MPTLRTTTLQLLGSNAAVVSGMYIPDASAGASAGATANIVLLFCRALHDDLYTE